MHKSRLLPRLIAIWWRVQCTFVALTVQNISTTNGRNEKSCGAYLEQYHVCL